MDFFVIMTESVNDLNCIDNIIDQYCKEALEELNSDENINAVTPKRSSRNKDSKVEFEEVMISIKDCFKLILPVVKNIISKSNKELIERQDAKEKIMNERIDNLEKLHLEKIEEL